MLRYRKGREPACLRRLRSAPGATWDDIGDEERTPIRNALVRDQGRLCAYCQRRLVPGWDTMRIDHVQPRSGGGPHFAWWNLVGACNGFAGVGSVTKRTCDRAKGDTPLARLNPVAGRGADPTILLRYLPDGTVTADDPGAMNDVESVLNLNAAGLKRGRRAFLDALRDWAKAARPSGRTFRRRAQEALILSGGPASEYTFVAFYHFNRWARKNGA